MVVEYRYEEDLVEKHVKNLRPDGQNDSSRGSNYHQPLAGTDKYMMLEKNGAQLLFDIKVRTAEGCVFAIYLVCCSWGVVW